MENVATAIHEEERTVDRNILYQRQEALDLTTPPSAIVVGLGGTGTWVAIFLAMSGCPVLDLYDFDRLEGHNLNRLPFSQGAVGLAKTVVVKNLIRALRPDCDVTVMPKATNDTLAESAAVYLFDCTDNQAVQKFLYDYAKANGKKYIRSGYDGLHITVTDYVSEWAVSEEEAAQIGYRIVPSWVVPAVVAASLAVFKAMSAPEFRLSSNLVDLAEHKMAQVNRVFNFDEMRGMPLTIEQAQIREAIAAGRIRA